MARTDVSVSTAERGHWTLRSAIMIYEGTNSGGAYATVHDVRYEGGRPVLGAGKPATKESCGDLARSLGEASSLTGFTPANLLYLGGRCAAWWRPPGKGHVYFNCTRGPAGDQFYDEKGAELLGKRAGTTPQPGLVFAVRGEEWYVYAVKGGDRPGRDTQLYRSPYFNVWKAGQVCTGTTPLPNKLSADALDAYERAFFGSNFTHANIRLPGKLVKFAAGPYAFWDALLRDKWKGRFPEEVLIEGPLTLAALTKKLDKGTEIESE